MAFVLVAVGAAFTATAQPSSAAATAPPAAAHAAPSPTLAEVAGELRAGRHVEAFRRVTAMADQGDARAALLALALLEGGSAMYGSLWSASPGQLRRWTLLAETALRELPAEVLSDHADGPNVVDRSGPDVLADRVRHPDRPRSRVGASAR